MTLASSSIRARIAKTGFVSIETLMREALYDPAYGYYMTRDPIGAAGDFITAPEISQIFGELIAAWVADTWEKIGAPSAFRLIEAGPGRGTLMADMLRTLGRIPAIAGACRPCLLEISPHLQHCQHTCIEGVKWPGTAVRWYETLDDTPDDLPVIVVANELLDACPVRQFTRVHSGWEERGVAVQEGALVYAYQPMSQAQVIKAAPHRALENVEPGASIETSPDAVMWVDGVLQRMEKCGGAGLLIDYGYTHEAATGDTLQAVYQHQPCDPLQHLGEADLTAHVDFGALQRQINAHPHASVAGLTDQGAFLSGLGGAHRAMYLSSRASSAAEAEAIQHAYLRLRDPDQMGGVFKVLGFSVGGAYALAGF